MIVRLATVEDIDSVANMSCKFWNSSTVYEEPCDWDHVKAMAELCLSHGLLVVAEQDSVLVGFCAGIMSPTLGSPEALLGAEVAWWVEPEHRNAETGKALMDKIEQAAKDAGVKYWNMSVMCSSSPEVGERIYQKRGYTKNEIHYMKVL